ncbi:DUF397 domain-containing protein [Streptomyces syringium]|uniref:DUF397 domain-containing protein n=1 Tax=Streptomyces syringium TaxID=76729 RepID=UPI003454C0C4
MKTRLQFRKSSFSDPNHECVEIAMNVADIVAIRDSKIPDGPTIRLSPASWGAFRAALATGALDL